MIDLAEGKKNLLILVQILQTSGFDITAEIYEKNDAEGHGTSRGSSQLMVEISGSDASLLTARNGEVLLAIEEVASQLLELRPDELDRLCFDADNFKVKREESLREAAEAAISEVRCTSAPYVFPPMISRERRLLHLALARSGYQTASTGETPRRAVVLYPAGMRPPEDRSRSFNGGVFR